NGSDVASAKAALLHRLSDHVLSTPRYFLGIVLHPSRLRINLFMLFLCCGYGPAGAIEDGEARAGGALINCSDVTGHAHLVFLLAAREMSGRISLQPTAVNNPSNSFSLCEIPGRPQNWKSGD